jgi:hypothetical protein
MNTAQTQKRFLLVDIEERNGEQEYRQHMLLEIPSDSKQSNDEIAEEIAQNWYEGCRDEDNEEQEKEDGGYYFSGGALFAEVTGVRELPEADYLILSKYNI